MCEFTYTHVWIQLPGAGVTGNYEFPNMCAGNPNSSSLWVASTLHHSCIYSTMSPQHSKTSCSPCVSLTNPKMRNIFLFTSYFSDLLWRCLILSLLSRAHLEKADFSQCNHCNLLTKLTHVIVHVCFFPFYPYQGVPELPSTWSWRSGHRETEEIVAVHSCRQP